MVPFGSKLRRMKPTILTTLLLTCGLAFGQKFQEVSAQGSPVSLVVKHHHPDMRPYAAARNNSSKAILAMVAVVRSLDDHGRVVPCYSHMDYAFKGGVLAPKEEGFACLINSADEGAQVKTVEGAVLFVQFDDGTTWGDPSDGKQLLGARAQKLAFLQKLVETYYENGEDAFASLLDERKLSSPEDMVAACLKSKAEYEKIATIDVAKKWLAAAHEWRALGIF
jgi:hypothetical protein